MNKSHGIFSISIIACLIFSASCGKPAQEKFSNSSNRGSAIEGVPRANHSVKSIDLGIAESFAVLAYTSISSAPSSNIAGKVGLKPGVRSLIGMNPSIEVMGGALEVYAGDDVGDSATYLSLAREDLISAYREALTRQADKDKMEAYDGKPGGKVLPAGIYKWSNGVSVNSDMTLKGSESDIFIFQVTGNLNIAPDAKITMSGGAQAKNVFWQVSGRVNLDTQSLVPGTIISQLTFEMKNLAQLNGRAFVKNGKLILSKNTISIPGL